MGQFANSNERHVVDDLIYEVWHQGIVNGEGQKETVAFAGTYAECTTFWRAHPELFAKFIRRRR